MFSEDSYIFLTLGVNNSEDKVKTVFMTSDQCLLDF